MKSLFKNLHLFSIRKLTIGTASVMLGSLFILGGSHNAHAAENESTINDDTNLEVQQKETIENESNNEPPIKIYLKIRLQRLTFKIITMKINLKKIYLQLINLSNPLLRIT